MDLLICALYAFFIKLLKTLNPLIGATDILLIEIKKLTTRRCIMGIGIRFGIMLW